MDWISQGEAWVPEPLSRAKEVLIHENNRVRATRHLRTFGSFLHFYRNVAPAKLTSLIVTDLGVDCKGENQLSVNSEEPRGLAAGLINVINCGGFGNYGRACWSKIVPWAVFLRAKCAGAEAD